MKIAIYCNNLSQLNFFLRFKSAFKLENIRFIIWSNRLSVVYKARSRDCEAELLSGFRYGDDGCLSSDSYYWYRPDRGLLTPAQTKRQISRLIAAADVFFMEYQPDMLWVWNGTNQICQALVDVGKSVDIQMLFFEIGNFPGKLFVDPYGVNCRSWYASSRGKILTDHVDLKSFQKWKSDYLTRKFDEHVVPQAKRVGKFNYHYFVDLLGFWFLGAITVEKLAPFWKITDFIKRQFFCLPFDCFCPIRDSGFIFYPLQVSTDSQVLWNCNLSQAEALRFASTIANRDGKILVVKPHPAEPHCNALQEIIDLKNELDFKLVNGNTFKYLQCCSRVVTLNSTVGLEAMLLDKPVDILGHALYAGFDELDMADYFQNYLLDIDYFSDEEITDKQLCKILERCTIGHV